jgi:hypothetical protein
MSGCNERNPGLFGNMNRALEFAEQTLSSHPQATISPEVL